MAVAASLQIEIGASVGNALKGIRDVNAELNKLVQHETDVTLSVGLQWKQGTVQQMARALKGVLFLCARIPNNALHLI